MRNCRGVIVMIFIVCQSCDKGNSINTSVNGTYESGTTLEVSNALMFTSSSYGTSTTSGSPGPITDQQVIAAYLQKHNISGFSLNTPTLNNSDKLTVTLADSGKVTVAFTNPSKIFQANIEDNRIFVDNTYGDSVLNIITVDSIPYASIPQDTCYKFNSTAAKVEYQGAGSKTGNNPTQNLYRRRYFTQFENGSLAVKFVTSSLIKNSSSITCSNLINGEWGTDAIRTLYSILPHLAVGDTLVIQTRKAVLRKK